MLVNQFYEKCWLYFLQKNLIAQMACHVIIIDQQLLPAYMVVTHKEISVKSTS